LLILNYKSSIILHYPHFSHYGNLREAVIGFGQFARDSEFNAGMQETLDALSIAGTELIHQRKYLRYALKAVYCCSYEEINRFDDMFDMFWSARSDVVKIETMKRNQTNSAKKTNPSIVMMGHGSATGQLIDTKDISGANTEERLRNTDFAKLEEIESEYLEEIAMKMWKQMSYRLKRRMKSAKKGDRLDLRQTIRRNIAHGGDLIELRMKSKKRRKQRLVVFLDVSGSMDKYSLFLLKFIWSLKTHFKKIEAFIFSTNLVRITDYLEVDNIEATLETMSKKVNNWSSGTRIGACFNTFNEEYAKYILNGKSTVIILSDGLDTGQPEVLSTALHRMKLRTKKIVWLNPLKGMKGYLPVQKGMRAALTEIDILRSAHSLNSLLELEELLVQV